MKRLVAIILAAGALSVGALPFQKSKESFADNSVGLTDVESSKTFKTIASQKINMQKSMNI